MLSNLFCLMIGFSLGVFLISLLTVNRLDKEYNKGYNDALKDFDKYTN